MENAKLTIDAINAIYNQMDHQEKHKILLLCKSTYHNINGQLKNEIKERQEGARKIARLLPQIIEEKYKIYDVYGDIGFWYFKNDFEGVIRTFYEPKDNTYYNFKRYNYKRLYKIMLQQLIKRVEINKWFKPKQY